MFRQYRESKETILLFANWCIELDNFYLECWTDTVHGAVIYQIYENGNGFAAFQVLPQIQLDNIIEAAGELTKVLKTKREDDLAAKAAVIHRFLVKIKP